MKKLMKRDFSVPQRQSLVGVVVMFADTLQGTVRALWPILVLWLFKINQTNKIFLGLAVGGVMILAAIVAYFKYRNFTFFLDEENEEFVINHGIINKSRVAIPLEKIQQVNINQSFIQKIIGVHAVEVDSAGSSKKEVSIRALKHDWALLLKDRLLEGSREANQAAEGSESYSPITDANTRAFIQISLLSLFKTGITSNYARSFALLFAFVVTVFQNAEEYIDAAGYDDPFEEYLNADLLLRFVAFIIMAVLVLTLLVNLVRTVFRYFNFRITKQQNGLLLSYGLINTKNTIIRPERVQMVGIGRNYFQKKMDILDLKIKQVSHEQSSSKEQRKLAMEIPGCNEAEKDILLNFILGTVPERGTALYPNIRKLILKIFKSLIIPLGIYFGAAQLFAPELYDIVVFVPIYIILIGLLAFFGYKNYRLFVNDDFIIKQSGAWDVDNEFLAPHKIQAVSLKQYFWQKKSNVGTVILYTAGGNMTFGVANYTKLEKLANYWLYKVETTDKDWM